MNAVNVCSRCPKSQRDCPECPFHITCDLHPDCQDQGCEQVPQSCRRAQALQDGTAVDPPEAAVLAWGALRELECRLTLPSDQPKWRCPDDRPQTPPVELSYTKIICPGCGRTSDDCDCHPGIYRVMLESNPYPRGGWLEHQFTKPPKEEPMSFAPVHRLIVAGVVYVLGVLVALTLATTQVKAFTPFVCHFGLGYATCDALHSSGAKIIHVDPPLNEDADGPTETREHYNRRCQPTLSRRDPDTGMQKWLYRERGCVYGPE